MGNSDRIAQPLGMPEEARLPSCSATETDRVGHICRAARKHICCNHRGHYSAVP